MLQPVENTNQPWHWGGKGINVAYWLFKSEPGCFSIQPVTPEEWRIILAMGGMGDR